MKIKVLGPGCSMRETTGKDLKEAVAEAVRTPTLKR